MEVSKEKSPSAESRRAISIPATFEYPKEDNAPRIERGIMTKTGEEYRRVLNDNGRPKKLDLGLADSKRIVLVKHEKTLSRGNGATRRLFYGCDIG